MITFQGIEFRPVPEWAVTPPASGLYASECGKLYRQGQDQFAQQRRNRKTGYRSTGWTSGGQRHDALSHRAVAAAWCPRASKGDQVDHISSDKANNRADNLEWVTPLENRRRAQARSYRPFVRGQVVELDGHCYSVHRVWASGRVELCCEQTDRGPRTFNIYPNTDPRHIVQDPVACPKRLRQGHTRSTMGSCRSCDRL